MQRTLALNDKRICVIVSFFFLPYAILQLCRIQSLLLIRDAELIGIICHIKFEVHTVIID